MGVVISVGRFRLRCGLFPMLYRTGLQITGNQGNHIVEDSSSINPCWKDGTAEGPLYYNQHINSSSSPQKLPLGSFRLQVVLGIQ